MGTGEWLRRERKKEKETDRYNTLTDKNCGTHQGGSRRPSPAMEASRRPSSKPPPLDSHLRLLDFFVSFSFLLFLSSSRGPSSSRSARRRRVLGPQQAEEGGGGRRGTQATSFSEPAEAGGGVYDSVSRLSG